MRTSFLQTLSRIPRKYLVLAVFAVLVVLFYGNTLFNGFVYDDGINIVQNSYVQSLRYIPKILTTCFWADVYGTGCEGGGDGMVYYRPLMAFSYLFSYQISSAAWFFHLINLLYLLVAAFLVFLLLKTLTKKFLLSFLTGFLFLIHPINSEVINFVSAVPELLYLIFILLATIFYARYRQVETREVGDSIFQNKNLLFTFLFFSFGMLAKEPAILFPAIALSLDIFVFKISLRRLLFLKELKPYFIFGVIAFIYMGIRFIMFHGFTTPKLFYQFTVSERIYAFFDLFSQYLAKLTYPYPLLAFYPFEKKSDFLSLEFFLIGAVFLLYVAAFYFFLKSNRPLHAFFLVWIGMFLLPVLLFLNSVGENIFSERYLYASTIGFAFLLSSVLIWLFEHGKRELRLGGLVVLLLVAVGSWLIIYPRNTVWHDNEILYNVTLAQNPDAHFLRFDRAVDLGTQKGDFEAAKKEFEEIERRNSNWLFIYKVYNNLGDVYQMEGDIEKAIEYYQKSIDAAEGARSPLYNTIGVLYAKQEQYFAALPYLCKAVQFNPQFGGVQENFSRVISVLETQKEEAPEAFYENLLAEQSFSLSSVEKVRFIQRECSEEACTFSFISRLEEGDTVLPFLIQGVTPSGDVLALREPVFNLQTGMITIESDAGDEEQTVSFIFPTCEGVYYEAETTP